MASFSRAGRPPHTSPVAVIEIEQDLNLSRMRYVFADTSWNAACFLDARVYAVFAV